MFRGQSAMAARRSWMLLRLRVLISKILRILYRDYGNYSSIIWVIQGLYRDNGKENGNYYIIIG